MGNSSHALEKRGKNIVWREPKWKFSRVPLTLMRFCYPKDNKKYFPLNLMELLTSVHCGWKYLSCIFCALFKICIKTTPPIHFFWEHTKNASKALQGHSCWESGNQKMHQKTHTVFISALYIYINTLIQYINQRKYKTRYYHVKKKQPLTLKNVFPPPQ